MVALRGFAGNLAKSFDRPERAGFELVAVFQGCGIFDTGHGGYLGKGGAEAHSADAVLLALALASRELNAQKAVEAAWNAYKMPSMQSVGIMAIAPGTQSGFHADLARSEAVANPFGYFGHHLAALVHLRRRASIEGDFPGDAWKGDEALIKKRGIDSFQFGIGGLAGGTETRFIGYVQSPNWFSAGEWRSVKSVYCGDLAPRFGKYDRGCIREVDGDVLDEIAAALGGLTAETSADDERVDYRHKSISLEPMPPTNSDAFEIALKMARGS